MRIGLYNRWLPTMGGGERHSLAIAAALSRAHDVSVLSHSGVSPAEAADRLQLRLDAVRFVRMPATAAGDLSAHSREYDLFINASHGVYFPNRARLGALMVFFPTRLPSSAFARIRPMLADYLRSWLPTRLYHTLFERRFPGIGARLAHPVPADLRAQIDSYNQIWANSKFTQRWIQTYWQRESCLLYPPVAISNFVPGTKRAQILSVGRFFRGHHNKKHEVMVQTFRELVRAELAQWELHLAGGTLAEPAHQAYLTRIRKQAQGVPIYIHADVSDTQLRKLYGESALYWHAAGYGEDEQALPGRMEHFGMSTVEAMAAQCTPIVLGKGGQTELIDHGVDGYLWYTTDQLKRYSRQLAENADLRQQMALRAQARSRQFGEVAFEKRLRTALAAMELEL